jgi:outer membrane protein OmpA-like peptidoglycan-associated protein
MNRGGRAGMLMSVILILTAMALPRAGHAGLADAMKQKLAERARRAAAAADKPPAAAEGDKPASSEEGKAAGAAGSGGGAGIATVSTKFDFVPGDSVIFLDDFKLDDLGEFPSRWRLSGGTFEVAEMGGERWLRCTSVDGSVRMKLPATNALPEFWTLEFDFHGTEPMGSALTVRALGRGGGAAWEATFPQGSDLAFRSGDLFSTTTLEAPSVGGRHHFMFMGRGKAIKAYIDRQRVANVPEYADGAGTPVEFEIRLWAPSHPMIANVRFAEGCRPAKDMLAAGRLVTHGILFETGSDVVLAESAPVLRQVAAYLQANPAVRLRITGHTDNVGSAAANLALSARRAASVARVLSGQLAIAADRFETDGKGDTKPVSNNAKPEGRAMNRRVEFEKLE